MIYDENDKILKLYFLSAGGRERLLIIVSISKQFHSDIENIWSKCFNLNTVLFLFARVRIVGCSGGVESVAAPPPTLNCRQENINRQIVFPGRGQLPDHWAIFHRECDICLFPIFIFVFLYPWQPPDDLSSVTLSRPEGPDLTPPPPPPTASTGRSYSDYPDGQLMSPTLAEGWRCFVITSSGVRSEEWGVLWSGVWGHWGGQEGSRWCVVSVLVRTPPGQHTPLPALHCKHSNIF